MSKDILLRDNATGETETLTGVSKLKLPSPGSLPVYFVPEDETKKLLAVKITKNGNYPASALNAYGIKIAQVDIDVTKTVVNDGISFNIYVDTQGKPHIHVSKVLPT